MSCPQYLLTPRVLLLQHCLELESSVRSQVWECFDAADAATASIAAIYLLIRHRNMEKCDREYYYCGLLQTHKLIWFLINIVISDNSIFITNTKPYNFRRSKPFTVLLFSPLGIITCCLEFL